MAAPYSMHDDVNIDATLAEADIFRRLMCKHNYVNVIAHLTVVREPASKKVLRELLLKLHLEKARERERERGKIEKRAREKLTTMKMHEECCKEDVVNDDVEKG